MIHITLKNANKSPYTFTFGQYAGKTIEEVFKIDFKYVDWVYNKVNKPNAVQAIHDYIVEAKRSIVAKYVVPIGKYSIGNLQFSTKTNAKKMVSEWLQHSYSGYVATDEDLKWIIPLFKMHPRFEDKGGLEMVGIEIGFASTAFHFNVVLENGMRTDFSYIKCMNGYANTKKHDVMIAMRDIIRPQIMAYKRRLFSDGNVVCSVSGMTLHEVDLHIDHHFELMPFKKIVDDFLNKENITVDDIPIVSLGVTHDIDDHELRQRWYDFHEKKAILRPVHKHINLTN